MSEIRIVAQGVPIPKGSVRYGRGANSGRLLVLPDNPGLTGWCAWVALRARVAVKAAGGLPAGWIDGRKALAVDALFVLPRPKRSQRRLPAVRPDIDKLLRAVLDACTGVVWGDDGQVVDATARKRYERKGLAVGAYVLVRNYDIEIAQDA